MKIRIKEDEVSSAVSQLKSQMSAFMGGMEDALEDKSKNQEESVVLTTASLLLALPAILGLIARLGKAMSSIIKRTIGTASQNQNYHQYFHYYLHLKQMFPIYRIQYYLLLSLH